jgi:hypothetical protein
VAVGSQPTEDVLHQPPVDVVPGLAVQDSGTAHHAMHAVDLREHRGAARLGADVEHGNGGGQPMQLTGCRDGGSGR